MLKNSRIRIFLALCLIQGALTVCEEGTLACYTSGDFVDTPKQCDLTNHYVLSADQKSCVKKQVEGCQLAAYNEVSNPCLLCEAGNVYDVERKKCVAVSEEAKIQNCKRYNPTDSSCQMCEVDYFLDASTSSCAKVTTKVESCEVYKDGQTCSFCETGSYLLAKKCLKIPTMDHCQKVTDRECQGCNSGFILDRTSSTIPEINDTFLHSIQQGVLTLSAVNVLETQKSVCSATSIVKCVEYENEKKCKTCHEDYFVNGQGKCEKNPLQPLPFCSKYSDQTTCIECQFEFYLKGSPAECAAVTPVENCDTFRKDIDQCDKCISSHFYNEGTKTCDERKNSSIDNCTAYELNSDGCKTCTEGFTKTTTTALKCLSNPENCKAGSLVKGGDSGTKHTCSQCVDDKHYIDSDGLCKARDVSNCGEYAGTTNNCTKCDTNYWLDGSSCSFQSLGFCKKHVENKNECETCNDKYVLDNPTTCSVTSVEFCEKYDTNTNDCKECQGSKVLVANKCEESTKLNCQKFVTNEDKCEVCEAGYYVHTDFTCKVQELANCVVHEFNKNECLKCSLGFHLSGTTCAENTVQNCTSYIENENKCASCAKSYYYVSGSKSCVRQELSGCIAYTDNLNVCTKCQVGQYLDGTTSQCQALSKNNCIDYTPNTNHCSECAASHYLDGSGASATCKLRNKTNCPGYDGNTNNCTTCTAGHIVVGGACVVPSLGLCATNNVSFQCEDCGQGKIPNNLGVCVDVTNIPFCLVYKTTEQGCTTCTNGKIPSVNGLSCDDKNVLHCLEYDSSTTQATCTKCDPKQVKKIGNAGVSCDPISLPNNCVRSAGTSADVCDACAPGFNFAVTPIACSVTDNTSKFDFNCTGHGTISSAKAHCSVCKSNFTPISHNFQPLKDPNSINCSVLNASGTCSQCKEYFELAGDGTCSATGTDHATLKCIQTQPNSEKTLVENQSCAKCNDKHFLDAMICKDYTKSKLVYNCGKLNGSSDQCFACAEGHYSYGLYFGAGTCEVTVPSILNCLVWSTDNRCIACKEGYEYDPASSGSCKSQLGNEVRRTFDQFMDPTGSKIPPNIVDGCGTYFQSSPTEIACGVCTSGKVAIVKYDPTNTEVIPFSVVNKNFANEADQDVTNKILKCVSRTTQYLRGPTKPNENFGCVTGYEVADHPTGYSCLNNNAYGGKLNYVDTNSSNQIIGQHFSLSDTSRSLTDLNIFKKLYQMKGSFQPDLNGYFLRYNVHFSHDSIVNSGTSVESTTNKLLYLYYPLASGHLVPTTKKFSNGDLFEQMYSIVNGNIDLSLNCQFYLLKSDLAADIVDMSAFDFKGKVVCGACKPGFKPVRVNNAIGSCTAITAALYDPTPLKNKWLNMAQTPVNDGWKWDVSVDVHFLDLAEPVTAAQKIANCYAVDTVNSKCVFCKESFLLLDGICHDTANAECHECIGRADYDIPATPFGQMVQYNSLVFKRHFPNNASFINWLTPHCQCHGDYAVLDVTKTFTVCRNMPKPVGAASDCKLTKYNDNSKCYQCQPTATKNTTSELCIAKITNCVETSDGTACTLCEDGYIPIGGSCVLHNCKEWDPTNSSKCLICKDNKNLVQSVETHCSDTPIPDSDCLNVSPITGFCVKSVAANKVPYYLFDGRISSLIPTKIFHMEWDRTVAGYGSYNSEYLVVTILVQKVGNNITTTSTINILETQSYKNKKYNWSKDLLPAQAFCVPTPEAPAQCKTMSDDGMACIECNDTYMVSVTQTCESIPTLNCVKFDLTDCLGCDSAHFLQVGSGDAVCKNNLRVKSAAGKCKTFELNSDACIDCLPGFYFDSGECKNNTAQHCASLSLTENKCAQCLWNTGGSPSSGCLAYTVDNCAARHATLDQCSGCANGYSLVGSDCVASTATNCKTWTSGENKCGSCSSLFLFDSTPSALTCTKKTKNKCNSYHATNDECATCELGQKLNGGTKQCEWNSADNCGSYTQGSDLCTTCSTFSYKSGNNCILRKAIDCKEFGADASADTCQVCSNPTYKLGNTCTRPTEKKCLVVEDAADKCTACLGGWQINGSFTCDKNNSGKCPTYTPDNKCATCYTEQYLTGSGECEQNTALDCNEKSTTSNECVSCKADHWKDTLDANKCKLNTAENCKDKSQSKNECSICSEKHYKDVADNKKCKAHTAENCATYEAETDLCLTCLETVLDHQVGVIKTCSKYLTHDCLTFSKVKDECTSCKVAEFYLHDNGEKKICQKREVTDHCNTFNPTEDKCTGCENKTYLKDHKCVSSKVVLNCKTYSGTEDMCTVCEDNYFKSKTENECWLFPDGIAGCVRYHDRTKCLACDSKTYLSENKCVAVPKIIDDCLEYESETKCAKCRPDRFFEAAHQKCTLKNNPKCKEFEDKDTCKSCLDPNVFNFNLKKCEPSGIANCLQATYFEFGNTCQTCENGLLVSANKHKCEPPTKKIDKCLQYETKTSCRLCEGGYIMDSSGSKCTVIGVLAGSNCSVARFVADHVCEWCRLGSVKNKSGKCEKLELDYCIVPSEDLSTCLMCSPISFMNKDGKCQPLTVPVPESQLRLIGEMLLMIALGLMFFK